MKLAVVALYIAVCQLYTPTIAAPPVSNLTLSSTNNFSNFR